MTLSCCVHSVISYSGIFLTIRIWLIQWRHNGLLQETLLCGKVRDMYDMTTYILGVMFWFSLSLYFFFLQRCAWRSVLCCGGGCLWSSQEWRPPGNLWTRKVRKYTHFMVVLHTSGNLSSAPLSLFGLVLAVHLENLLCYTMAVVQLQFERLLLWRLETWLCRTYIYIYIYIYMSRAAVVQMMKKEL